MSDKHCGLDYETETFDPVGYFEDVWGPEALVKHPLTRDNMDEIHTIFQKLKLPEKCTQLDFGCGPSIHFAISSSRVCPDIVLSEYSGQNRRLVQKWLKGEDDSVNWSHMFEYIGKKEERSPKEIEMRTRAAIKEIVPCDILKDDIFGVAHVLKFDVVTVSYSIDAACKDIPTYHVALRKLAEHIKPGGYIVMSGLYDNTCYTVRGKLFYNLGFKKEDVEKGLAGAGFEVVDWYTHEVKIVYGCQYDGTSYFTLVGRKQ